MALTVNGESVDEQIIEGEFSQIKAYYESLGSVSCCDRDEEFHTMAKENVLARVLLVQEVEQRNIIVDERAVEEAFDRLADEHGAREHVLIEAGLTLDQEDVFRDELRSNLRLEKMLEDVCGSDESPAESDLEKVYTENLALFSSPEEVRASHIFKSPQPVEKREEFYSILRTARKRAMAGEEFDVLVREYSDKPEAESDLGYFKKGDLMEEFESIAFSMEVDEISPVFITQWGLHLAKITDRKPSIPKKISEVKEEVTAIWRDARRKEKIDAFVAELRAQAEISDDDPDDASSDD